MITYAQWTFAGLPKPSFSLHTWLLVASRPIPTKHTDYLPKYVWTTIWNLLVERRSCDLKNSWGELRQAGRFGAPAMPMVIYLTYWEDLNGTDAEIYVDINVLKQLLIKTSTQAQLLKKTWPAIVLQH